MLIPHGIRQILQFLNTKTQSTSKTDVLVGALFHLVYQKINKIYGIHNKTDIKKKTYSLDLRGPWEVPVAEIVHQHSELLHDLCGHLPLAHLRHQRVIRGGHAAHLLLLRRRSNRSCVSPWRMSTKRCVRMKTIESNNI